MKAFKILFLCCCLIMPVQTNAQLLKGIMTGIAAYKQAKKANKQQNVPKRMAAGSKTSINDNSSTEVVLTVSADGLTKDEAVKTALRSAIEQAYGTFVSANTTILNDELVSDEVISVTSGNIKDYNEIASSTMPDGRFFVTLQATVSVSKLISYAKSKGAETEFAGNVFAMNMKLQELNKQNEIKALNNLLLQIKEMYPSCFSYELELSEPSLLENRNDSCFSMRLPTGGHIFVERPSAMGLKGAPSEYCFFVMNVKIVPNQLMNSLKNFVIKTLTSLALTEDELLTYKENGYEYYSYYSPLIKKNLYFRSVVQTYLINSEIAKILHNFEIVDNTGTISKPTAWKIDYRDNLFMISGTGLLDFCGKWSKLQIDNDGQPGFSRFNGVFSHYPINGYKGHNINLDYIFGPYLVSFPVLIRKDEIGKYSNFEIRKSTKNIEIN